MIGDFRTTFGKYLENFRKSSENLQKPRTHVLSFIYRTIAEQKYRAAFSLLTHIPLAGAVFPLRAVLLKPSHLLQCTSALASEKSRTSYRQ